MSWSSIETYSSEDAFDSVTSTDIGSSNGVIEQQQEERKKKQEEKEAVHSLSKALKSTSLSNNAVDNDNQAATYRADRNGIQRTLQKVCLSS